MRSTEERVAAVERRVAQIERQKRQRRNRVAALSSVAACLIVIMGASFIMPGIVEKMAIGDYTETGYDAAASIFGGSVAVGYVVIGLLAFALGVCVTVLCFKLEAFRKTDREGEGMKGTGGFAGSEPAGSPGKAARATEDGDDRNRR